MNRPMNRKERRMQKKAGGQQPPQQPGGAQKVDPAQLQRAIAITMDKAFRLLGEEKYEQAANLFIDVLQVEPGNTVARFNVGQVLALMEKYDKAAECFEKVLETAPEDDECRLALARVRIKQDRLDETMRLLEGIDAARVTAPALCKLYTSIGVFHHRGGDAQTARAWYEKAMAADPDSLAPYLEIGQMSRLALDEPVAQKLLAAGETREKLPEKIRAGLCFSLGRLHMNNKDAQKAFAFFEEANRLKKATLPDRTARLEGAARAAIRLFDAQKIRALEEAPPTALADMPLPIFIIGMPRSGSTLTDQILVSHPDVASIGESSLFMECLPLPENKSDVGEDLKYADDLALAVLEKMSPAELRAAGDAYLRALKERAGGKRAVVNKMLFNYPFVPVIRAMMPEAKIIHCTRDPADIGLSIWQLPLPDGISWAYDLRDIAHYYRCYRTVMNHWEKILPQGAMLEMNYEATVADQEGRTRRLLDFCGLPWDDACLRFYENDRRVLTASTAQVRQPMYTGSVRKWKKYENYLGPLLDGLSEGDIALS